MYALLVSSGAPVEEYKTMSVAMGEILTRLTYSVDDR